MTTVALPEMKRHSYSLSLNTGTVAAGGSVGILIPPSVIFIVYGIATEQSKGED
jgi:C4-dicarboxylate transporter DctM subunit